MAASGLNLRERVLKSKKIIVVAVAALALISIFIWSRVDQPPLEVWVAAVEKGRVEATVANTRAGTVKACRRSKLSMPIGGVVDRLLVDEGDQVEEGQLLLELWNRDRKADVEQAEQTYQAARYERERACLLADLGRREAERIEKMAAKKLVSEESVDSAVTTAESQERNCEGLRHQEGVAGARLEFQRAILERTQLKAPFAGVVAEINGEVGEYVTPSPPGVATPPAVDLIDYSCLYVTAPIDEVDAGLLRTGLPARITLDAFRDLALQGEVVRIAPYVLDLEKQARTVDIDVQLTHVEEAIKLLVGYSADITVILESREQVLRFPTEALLPDNRVWVLEGKSDGQLRLRDIKTGIGNWTHTQVLEGLSEGELVVRNPDNKSIADGVTAVPADD